MPEEITKKKLWAIENAIAQQRLEGVELPEAFISDLHRAARGDASGCVQPKRYDLPAGRGARRGGRGPSRYDRVCRWKCTDRPAAHRRTGDQLPMGPRNRPEQCERGEPDRDPFNLHDLYLDGEQWHLQLRNGTDRERA